MPRINKILRLPAEERRWIDEQLFAHVPQREIVDEARERGIDISKGGIARYAQTWDAKMERFQIASEKAEMMLNALGRGMDLTAAATKAASSVLLERLLVATEEDLEKADFLDVVQSLAKLSRAETARRKQESEEEERERKRAAVQAAKQAEEELDREAAEKDIPLKVLNQMRGAIGLPPLEARRGS